MWREEVSLTQPHTKVMSGQRIFFLFSLNQSMTLHSSIHWVKKKKKSALPETNPKQAIQANGHCGCSASETKIWRTAAHMTKYWGQWRMQNHGYIFFKWLSQNEPASQVANLSVKGVIKETADQSASHPTSQSTCQSECWSVNRCVTQ